MIHSGPTSFSIDDLTHPPTSHGSCSVLYVDDLLLFRTIKGQEDFQLLQDDISSINKCVQQNHLTFNSTKCKTSSYMVISRKRRPTHPEVLHLGDTPLEQIVNIFFASDLSFSQHIGSVCSKARKILGLLYRRFYNYSSKNALIAPIVPLTAWLDLTLNYTYGMQPNLGTVAIRTFVID